MGAHSADITDHACRMIKAREQEEERHPRFARPRSVPEHLARHPIHCDECGETYWASDPYASHKRCGKTKTDVGF